MGDICFDDQLLAARGGDELAFAALFRAVQPSLLRYLGVVAGQAAEDVAAETWICVVRDLHRFSGDLAGFRAWVLSIGRHRWLDSRRAASRRPELASDLIPDQAGPADVASSVDELISTEAALRLIATLPRDQAEAVMLRVVVGLDVADTASIMGKRSGAVRVLAHRGLRRLEQTLAHQQAVTAVPRQAVKGT